MTDYDDDQFDSDDNPVAEQRKHIKNLESQLREAEQQIAVAKTGLNLNEKQVKALLSAHDGDLTPDAITATAQDLGFVQSEPEEEVVEQPAPEAPAVIAEAHAAMAQATSTGAAPPPAPEGTQALANFRDALWNADHGSGDLHLAQLQEEFEKVLTESGGAVRRGLMDIGPFEPM